jgi:uncharacterized protein YbjT (DUF2867 family)
MTPDYTAGITRYDIVIMNEKTSETKTMKIVVLGGTGLIGSKVVNLLRAGGHEVVAASPSQGINSITGEGLTEALTGAQVVVDVTNSPSFEDKAVLEFFETSTRNVLAAEAKTGVGHHVALSSAPMGFRGVDICARR